MRRILTTRVRDIGEAIGLLQSQPKTTVFRGMANASWRLVSSIDRKLGELFQSQPNFLLDAKQHTGIELALQYHFLGAHEFEFRRLLHATSTQLVDNYNFLHLQVFLQHYGYPTRILDFTRDFKKAMYFCLEDLTEFGDISIVMVDTSHIENLSSAIMDPNYLWKHVGSPISNYYDQLKIGVYVVNLPFFARIKAQEGVFLASGRSDYDDFEDQICEAYSKSGVAHRIVIPASSRKDIQSLLVAEGIVRTALYPFDMNEPDLHITRDRVLDLIRIAYPKNT